MNKDEALKMAIVWLDNEDVINACKKALEQPTKSITEGATMFKQVGNSPKPSPPPPIHTCTYSRTINQEYPRKCVHCGKVEALEQPTVAELNDEYLRDTHVIGLEQPAQEPLTRAQQVILANNKALEPVAWLENGNVNWAKYPNDQSKPIQLYTHPHQWQGLTDDENEAIIQSIWEWGNDFPYDEYRICIEQALKEKNHA